MAVPQIPRKWKFLGASFTRILYAAPREKETADYAGFADNNL